MPLFLLGRMNVIFRTLRCHCFQLGRMNIIFRTLRCHCFQLGRTNIGACKYVFLYWTGIF